MPRAQHQPTEQTRRTVESMSGYGIPQEDIAVVLGLAPKTLRKHYRKELDTAEIKANAKVAESLFKKATGDGNQAVTAAIFWAKTRMGWKDTTVLEHTGKDGGPIKSEVSARDLISSKLAGIASRIGTDNDPSEPDG